MRSSINEILLGSLVLCYHYSLFDNGVHVYALILHTNIPVYFMKRTFLTLRERTLI